MTKFLIADCASLNAAESGPSIAIRRVVGGGCNDEAVNTSRWVQIIYVFGTEMQRENEY